MQSIANQKQNGIHVIPKACVQKYNIGDDKIEVYKSTKNFKPKTGSKNNI